MIELVLNIRENILIIETGADMSNQGILTETGNNEVEIIEFYVGGQSFGVNVAKVKQIVQLEDDLLTPIPNSAATIKGTYQYRDHAIGLIDLREALNKNLEEIEVDKPLILITEFNDILSGFTIDAVNRIHRISWDKLEPMGGIFSDCSSTCTGTIHIEDRDILILDLESILAHVNPGTIKGLHFKPDSINAQDKRAFSQIKVYFAEDSNFIRETMTKSLTEAGFHFAGIAENGQLAWDELEAMADTSKNNSEPIENYVNVLVSDIEMPQMDGLTLCKNVKEHYLLRTTPVILFSSLINDQMISKCKSVGADANIAKPKTAELIELIKELTGK